MLLLTAIFASVVSAGITSSGGDLNNDKSYALQFSVLRSCGSWVRLRWDASPGAFPATKNLPHFTSCEIMYMNLRKQEARLLMVVPHTEINELTLEHLQPRSQYMASMMCNDTFSSPTIYFVMGFPCTDEEVEKARTAHSASDNTTEISQHPVLMTMASDGMSVKDTVLGLFFAMFGVTVISCAAFYYWKKRRHRQRILQIFRQSQSGSFTALNTSADRSSTSSI